MPSIIFKKDDSGKTVLQPDRPGANPGDTLQASNGDLVTWNNETNDIHHPVAIGLADNFITDEIPPGRVSSPMFNADIPDGQSPPFVITYQCSRHPDNPDEKGTITVGP